jgi:hypothetical protein
MRLSRFRAVPSLLALASLTAAGCGPARPTTDGGGMLSEDGPFVEKAEGSVRTIVLTASAEQRQAMEPARCSLQAWLFDTAVPAMRNRLATEGECRLYPSTAELALERQQWICAGAITASYGGRDERLSLCPELTPVRAEGAQVPIECNGLTPGASVRVSSEAEIDGDVLTDLDVSLTLPDAVHITQPSDLGITTWPANGPLEVRWTSENATSAIVTLTVRGDDVAPVLVCLPRTNGQLTIPTALLVQGGFRQRETMLRVASFRDAHAMAEGGRLPYRVAAGVVDAVLLQPER